MKKKTRKHYDEAYKKRIVQEYLAGGKASEIAEAEGLVPGQIYSWKSQLENRAREERIETIQTEAGVSLEEARRIRELEEELLATQQKMAQLTLENDLLKKLHPDFQFERKSSGYIETKRRLGPRRGRSK